MKKAITFLCLGLAGASFNISASALPETDNDFSGRHFMPLKTRMRKQASACSGLKTTRQHCPTCSVQPKPETYKYCPT